MTTTTSPRFDEIERHPDDAVTAYTYFPPAEKTKRLYAATTDALVVPGPRVVEAAEWVAALLRREPDR